MKTFASLRALTVAAVSFGAQIFAAENFNATYGSSPAPFKIDVSPTFVKETVQKASLTRYVVDIEQPDLVDGPPRHNVTTVRDYWVNHYNWFNVQDYLNKRYAPMASRHQIPNLFHCWSLPKTSDTDITHRYHHFTTSVLTGPRSNFTDPVPLHFVHHRSNRTDAIPLMFIHGWPGSFMEVDNILDGLVNPPNASSPAFHVVAPSIPGFAFSPAPRKPGWGTRETGYAFHALMQQLNYSQYVIQGGDFGGVTLHWMAADNPTSVVSILSNFWPIAPNDTDLARYSQGLTTADENTTIETLTLYETQNQGYRLIQDTKPLAVAIGMTDSPVGFAMWIYNLMVVAVDHYVWTPEEIITWSMMYYIQGPYGGMRFYKEVLREVRYFH